MWLINVLLKPEYTISLSSLLWSGLLYKVGCFTEPRYISFKFSNILVALLHDSIAVILSSSVLLSHPFILGSDNSVLSLSVINFSLGYFLADFTSYTVHGIKTKQIDYKQLLHHTCCIVGSTSSIVTGKSALDLSSGLLLTHMSSPFGYLYYLAKELGYRTHPTAVALKKKYVTTKTITITCISPVVVFSMVTNCNTPLLIKLTAVGILLVNILWLSTTIIYWKKS